MNNIKWTLVALLTYFLSFVMLKLIQLEGFFKYHFFVLTWMWIYCLIEYRIERNDKLTLKQKENRMFWLSRIIIFLVFPSISLMSLEANKL